MTQADTSESRGANAPLESLATELAGEHEIAKSTKAPPHLLRRLETQERLLEAIHLELRKSTEIELAESTATEWILDNYYTIQLALDQIAQDLPPGYYEQLPKLTQPDARAGFPRVYDTVRKYVLLQHAYVDIKRLRGFLEAYQAETPLTMGEVWAVPIMLRFCLLESLVEAGGKMTGHLDGEDPLDPALTMPMDIASAEIVANCITSLRLIDSHDWQQFFEDLSVVERLLRQDPVDIYPRMTFMTRDQYRKVVEKLAVATGHSEGDVARQAVRLAEEAADSDDLAIDEPWDGLDAPPEGHVGYYLLGPARATLEQAIDYHPAWWRRWLQAHTTAAYLGSIALLTLLILLLFVSVALSVGASPLQTILTGLIALIPASGASIGLVNLLATTLVKPTKLPKLDLTDGIPEPSRTLVVVPALLSSEDEVDALLSQLEQHYLRNPDLNLGFGLLTDYVDAPEEHLPDDETLLDRAKSGIDHLNDRYPDAPFYLFHRRRLYNPSENSWMGWERKRGKLEELNQLIAGNEETSFVVTLGDLSILPQVRYVITLDADTVLPTDTAGRLIGTLAHPLNQARFEPDTERVIAGYTIIQPRTEVKPTSAGRSLFTRVFAGDVGLDLYSMAVSDIYQDLFAEGIYVGKGIYDVAAFKRSLEGRVPENRLLSHDLFEGVHGRAALATDIVLYEEFPPHYLAFVQRADRWIRGDWQLLPWLWGTVPTTEGRQPTDLSLISRWKIFDNLRRSLVAPALLLLFLAAWLWLPGSPLMWTVVILALTLVTLASAVAVGLLRGLGDASWREVRRPIRDTAIRWLLQMAFLPYEALLSLDATSRTIARLLITRRHLLQWTTAAHTTRLLGDYVSAERTAGQMIRSLLFAVGVLIAIVIWRPEALLAAAPLLLLWVLSSEIAHFVSRPHVLEKPQLTLAQEQRLRVLARRTWLFFEEFVGPEDNWLPPDHFQEMPWGTAAHRTSPTNIGLYLTSTLAAYRLGYIGTLNLSLRLEDTFGTLDRLERYNGHFLNWIDTQTLHPLHPRYVSTVDSGNLAASLIALRQSCLAMKDKLVWRPQRWQGLIDSIAVLQAAITTAGQDHAGSELNAKLADMREQVASVGDEPTDWLLLLDRLLDTTMPDIEYRTLELLQENLESFSAGTVHEWRLILELLQTGIVGMRRELDLFMPWLVPLQTLPVPFASGPDSVRTAWQELHETLAASPSLRELRDICLRADSALNRLEIAASEAYDEAKAQAVEQWSEDLKLKFSQTCDSVASILATYELLARRAAHFVNEMDYAFLYNRERHVFHIGYNLERHRLDSSYYDLLASEARIASLIAIAKRDVPLKHWLHLGRPLTELSTGITLLSWSGTMFEFQMPPLFLRNYDGTLLAQSGQAVVDYQIDYGESEGIPWGISESGYYLFDNNMNYQYRAFGVPGTGLKRGLSDDLVVAPYASLLALSARPQAVMANLDHLLQYEMMGTYGLYEALDFTPSRVPLGQKGARVRSFMSHHQGMILMAVANYLHDDFLVNQIHNEPAIQSVELLLQEQVPANVPLRSVGDEEAAEVSRPEPDASVEPWTVPVKSAAPLVHHLSNGHLQSLITNAGGGYLMTPDMALTRWRPDTTRDNWGLWLYIQDQESGTAWSLTQQPVAADVENQEVRYFPHMVTFHGHHDEITAEMDIVVAPEADVEIRRVELNNAGNRPRQLRLTSYAEVVLTDYASDNRHPAFAKLFVESEFLADYNALLFRRRPRSAEESPSYMAHMLVARDGLEPTGDYESDRAQFLGRNRTIADPLALRASGWLTSRTGATLDPIMALGQDLELDPNTTADLAWLTLTADTRSELVSLMEKYRNWVTIERAFGEARAQAEQDLRQLELTTSELAQIQQLLSLLLYPHSALRADDAILAANTRGQESLWRYGVSGDYPILLFRVEEETGGELLTLILRAHAYWRRRGLQIDLVILNESASSYDQLTDSYIRRTVRRLDSEQWLDRRGGIFIIGIDRLDEADYNLFHTAARVVIDAESTSLEAQLASLTEQPRTLPEFTPSLAPGDVEEEQAPIARPEELQFDNGWGGFSPDGTEYVIYLEPDKPTPAPWINVIANERFGFLISDTGGGYSWAVNSGENRLTTWRNDPVSDVPAEALYLRDEETGEIWSPLPQPAPAEQPYEVRHGAGYTRFDHKSHQLRQQTTVFAATDAPVKIVRLQLENLTDRPRRFTVTYYAEWVLGSDRNITQAFIIPAYNADHKALLARNPYNSEFGEAVAFLAASKEPHGLTVDRTEFLGRLGNLNRPAALKRIGLSDSLQVDADPCAAIQLHVDLPPESSEEVYFLLGQGADEDEALAVIERFRDASNVDKERQQVESFWDGVLGTVQVETPDEAMDLLLNRWLLYQALSCRVWGRSALYQSGGAYGFRDQLQDVMSLLHARPDIAREHLLRSARHQFEAGDVLHWWHPPSDRGVRTRITDDLVWLPYVTAHYIAATDDESVLDERVPFRVGAPLEPDKDERYGQFDLTNESYSLYDHCNRALDHAATQGRNGLPLMGGGDWNDGMNRVGIEGHGESVWLSWFIGGTLNAFAAICEQRGDTDRAERYRQQARAYQEATEAAAWDGDWYLRAFYDDGTPLGSKQNLECRIDAIAQSWAVLTGLGDPERARRAMDSLERHLIQNDPNLMLLFTPPFDESAHDPGYIKGYIPGIRENGGQYTHAALWSIWAYADLGQGDKAESLFRMINPIYRSETQEKADHYKVEPYVISADVYGGGPPHAGRGGWTWYTGSSGWMYRLGIEGILGLRRQGKILHLEPRIPASWPGFKVTYRFGQARYRIEVENEAGAESELWLDGERLDEAAIPLTDEDAEHEVRIRLDAGALEPRPAPSQEQRAPTRSGGALAD